MRTISQPSAIARAIISDMATLIADTQKALLHAFGHSFAMTHGRNGTVVESAKSEGDGATPLGTYPIRAALIRTDRVHIRPMHLPWRAVHESDGWSDDVRDAAYNRPVFHPHGFSAEHLWRDDAAYDIILILGHNDSPPVRGAGSAIFFHCRNEKNYTEGCIAIARTDMEKILPELRAGDLLEII